MYSQDDPRSGLSTASGKAGTPAAGVFSPSSYARFYDSEPQQQDEFGRTWYARGQNFVVAYSETQPGARFERAAQPDEYVLLLPDAASEARVTAGGEVRVVAGYSIVMVPPGDSSVEVLKGGPLVRLISTRSADVAALCSNASAYAAPNPLIPPLQSWPEPPDGYRIRAYSLDVPPQEGRFGKIWRCTTFMVNVFPSQMGPRDTAKLSPHHHDDFEQCSLATGGAYMHHLRWPWTANLADWHEDEHELCASPSIAVIPPRVVHTSAAVDSGENLLVDIFSPPRMDFSNMSGWVLNADEYPMPA